MVQMDVWTGKLGQSQKLGPLLVTVVVKEPQGAYYGGTVAAPAVGEILREGLALLEVKPDAAGVKAKRDEWAKKTAEGRR